MLIANAVSLRQVFSKEYIDIPGRRRREGSPKNQLTSVASTLRRKKWNRNR